MAVEHILYWPGRFNRKSIAPPYTSLDRVTGNWQDVNLFLCVFAQSETGWAVPTALDGLVLDSSLAVASPPYKAVDSDIQR